MKKFVQDQMKSMQSQGDKGNQVVKETIKSPSDTTIYAPALQRKLATNDNRLGKSDENSQQSVENMGIQLRQSNGLYTEEFCSQQPIGQGFLLQQNNLNENLVSDFVEAVRIEEHPKDYKSPQRRKSDNAALGLQQAQDKAQRTVVEAEKFRAQAEAPGMLFIPNDMGNGRKSVDGNPSLGGIGQMAQFGQQQDLFNADKLSKDPLSNDSAIQMLDIGSGVSDDDFFHLTCHIEPNLIHKIEKGEFVELEKLLPKDKLGRSDESRLEWVQRDGETFLVPAQKDSKISGFRHWEQAFSSICDNLLWCKPP